MFRISTSIFIIILLFFSGNCWAKGPEETVDQYINKAYEILLSYNSEDLSEKKSLREKLSRIADEVFDFRLMSRMCLAVHWKDLNEQQQKEFVRLFTELLEKNYFSKIENYLSEIQEFDREKISIAEEILFSSRKAEVKSTIKYDNKTIPVNYRLVRSSSGWKVYDISVEGVSLVRNYRDQFRDFMMNNSAKELLEHLHKKIKKEEKGS